MGQDSLDTVANLHVGRLQLKSQAPGPDRQVHKASHPLFQAPVLLPQSGLLQ